MTLGEQSLPCSEMQPWRWACQGQRHSLWTWINLTVEYIWTKGTVKYRGLSQNDTTLAEMTHCWFLYLPDKQRMKCLIYSTGLVIQMFSKSGKAIHSVPHGKHFPFPETIICFVPAVINKTWWDTFPLPHSVLKGFSEFANPGLFIMTHPTEHQHLIGFHPLPLIEFSALWI